MGKQNKRMLVVAVAVLVAGLVIGSFFLLPKKSSMPTVTRPDAGAQVVASKDTKTETDEPVSTAAQQSASPAVDLNTLSSIDVTPLGVTVFYSKGLGGFEFSVPKTADNTQYAQFTSSDLIGAKCTDDQGVFASIIKNPSTNELQTTTQTIKVGSDTFGLSLAGKSCTTNQDLLTQYQDGFKAGFSSLKAL